ncbi:helicase-related protein [Actinokineospora sp. 24-640]
MARHVHGEMDAAVRADVLDHLRHPPPGGWTVVTNVRCLVEGGDIPAVDGAVFVDPKSQDTAIVQAIGRAERRSPETTDTAVIVVPIVIADCSPAWRERGSAGGCPVVVGLGRDEWGLIGRWRGGGSRRRLR